MGGVDTKGAGADVGEVDGFAVGNAVGLGIGEGVGDEVGAELGDSVGIKLGEVTGKEKGISTLVTTNTPMMAKIIRRGRICIIPFCR